MTEVYFPVGLKTLFIADTGREHLLSEPNVQILTFIYMEGEADWLHTHYERVNSLVP